MNNFIAKFIETIFSIFSIPLLLLNSFSVIVGVIWIIFLGDWSTIFIVIIALIVSPFLLSFPLMISIPFAYIGAKLYETGSIIKFFSLPFLIIAGIVTWVTISFWGLYSFKFILDEGLIFAVSSDINFNYLPYLLLSYSLATSPWQYMAQNEDQSNPGLIAALIFSQISAAFIVIFNGFIDPFYNYLNVYLVLMLIGFIFVIFSSIGELLKKS